MTGETILVALGANLPSPRNGAPRQTCEAAIAEMERRAIAVAARSRWYLSAPVPPSGQPPYVNGVVRVGTTLAPLALMTVLLEIEREFGRVRGRLNAPRILDLDLLAYGDRVLDGEQDGLVLPHPRLHQRAFVLRPLYDVCATWRHPLSGRSVTGLLRDLPGPQEISVLPP